MVTLLTQHGQVCTYVCVPIGSICGPCCFVHIIPFINAVQLLGYRVCTASSCLLVQMFGSPNKKFVCLGPSSGFSDHYGHFDILMGKHVEQEVFPLIHDFLTEHDGPVSRL